MGIRNDQAPQPTKEARGISGKSAVLFVGVMFLAYVASAVLADNPKVSEHLLGACFFLSAAVWAISTMFPVGWWTLKRTAILALVLFGGLLAFVFLGARR